MHPSCDPSCCPCWYPCCPRVTVGDTVTTAPGTDAQVRAAFDAYIFLSYRKKDRREAQSLMRLIQEARRIVVCGHRSPDGDALGHDWSRVWSSDETHHWHDCSRCDEKDNYEEHNPDRDHPTYEHPVLCEDCGYVIEEQLEEQTVRIELPFTLRVENTGDREPGREVFTFIAENFGEVVEYEVVSNTVETNGTNVYDGKFVIAVKEGDVSRLYEGFEFRQVKGTSIGWTYDETKYYVMLEPIINFGAESRAAYYWRVFGFGRDGQPDYDTPINGVSFVNSYKYKAPAAPAEPARPNPNTGVKGGHAMGMVLFLAGTAAAGIALSGKKDK